MARNSKIPPADWLPGPEYIQLDLRFREVNNRRRHARSFHRNGVEVWR